MLKKLEYICAVGSLAFIGADRIDLFAGHGFFKLTPFLFLASLGVFIQLLTVALRGKSEFRITPSVRRQIPFLLLLGIFLFLSALSTIFGLNPDRGIVALCNLALLAGLGFFVSMRIATDPEREKLMTRSITLGMAVWLMFCIAGYIAWSQGFLRFEEEPSTSIETFFAPTSTILSILPRLSGVSMDANRAGFVLVMYLALLDQVGERTRYARFLRYVITFFLLLTASRSALLCWLAYYASRREFWKRWANPRAAVGAVMVAAIGLATMAVYRQEVSQLIDLWNISDVVSERISSQQGTSGEDHIELIKRGIETWSRSPYTMLAGIGFAGSPRFLGDFFGDNKYGNFHCLYVSFLAELGLPTFLLFMVILFYPLVGRRGTLPCITAIAIFNIALQSYMEPVFWVTLALMWSLEEKRYSTRVFAGNEAAMPASNQFTF